MEEKKQNSVFGKVPVYEKASYAIASGGGNIITTIVGSFLSGYLTDSVGVAAAAVGTMMLIARIFDACSDVIMGSLIDKTHTKWGKARPWLLISAPCIAIGTILLFSVPSSLSGGGKIVYMYLTYIFLNCICYTMFMVPHTAMMSRISLNGQERQKMASLNQIINQFGALAVSTFIVAIVNVIGWTGAAAVYGIGAAACILIGFFFTKEHVGEAVDEMEGSRPKETVPIKEALPAMLKNKYFYLLTILFICILAMQAGTGSMTYYYCNIVLGYLGMLSFISACSYAPSIISNLFAPALTKQFGRRNVLFVSAAICCVSYLVIGLAGTNIPIVSVAIVIKSLAVGPIFSCSFAMASDVVDFGEWKTGIRSEGLINSCVSFGQKVGIGLGPAITTWVMSAGGYVGTAEVQTASAISAIKFGFGYFGAICCAIMAVAAFFMNIDKFKPQIEETLAKKHAAV